VKNIEFNYWMFDGSYDDIYQVKEIAMGKRNTYDKALNNHVINP